MLHREHADLGPRRDAGHRICHMQANTLLPHDDRSNVGPGRVLQDMIDRVAENDLDILTLQDFRYRFNDFHVSSLLARS